jgi:nucleoside-diphosphate kinase
MDTKKEGMIERTFAILKPEAIKNGFVGEILKRIELNGFKIIALKMVKASEDQAKTLYSIHKGKPFYETLVKHITSGPIICMVLMKENAIQDLRKLIGSTNPAEADPGTIRGDLGISITENMIHATDSTQSVEKEISIFFKDEELL